MIRSAFFTSAAAFATVMAYGNGDYWYAAGFAAMGGVFGVYCGAMLLKELRS
jgi:uncharacterized membrane protein YfcA